jgi:hypothetical protein
LYGHGCRHHYFGLRLAQAFASKSKGRSFHEIKLFRALSSAIIATAPIFPVEEFHGSRSQVVFSSCLPWTKTVARCELSDLCIVWFRTRPRPEARITFLQAKRSPKLHTPCTAVSGSIHEVFRGDSTQWYLLHQRPPLLGRYSTFQPPPNLLSDALLPSVASYCVFHRQAGGSYGLFYVSADAVSAAPPIKAGETALTAAVSSASAVVHGLCEQKWACCPVVFGTALYSGHIGTPIDHSSGLSPADDAIRTATRNWIGSIFGGTVREEVGPVIRAFLEVFDIATPEETTDPPSRSLIFIQGDESPGE